MKYAAILVREAWQGPVADTQKASLTDAILMKLRAFPHGGMIIDAIKDNLRYIFGVDVLNESRCDRYLEAWIASHLI